MANGVSVKKEYTFSAVTEMQRDLWDRFVETRPDGHLLQSWGWGEFKATTGWQPVRLALWKDGEIVAGAQVLRRTASHVPLWIGHLAYIPKGPLVDWSKPELCTMFFELLQRYVQRRGALVLQMEPGEEQGIVGSESVILQMKKIAAKPIHSLQPLRSIVLDLAPDEQTLLAQMKEKWRYNVRLASKRGVKVRAANSVEDVRAWYALYQTTGERDQFGIHTFQYYLDAWQIFAPGGKIRLLMAEHDGQLLAGIFVACFGGQAIYLYGASSNEQRQLMPNYLLQWEAIRWVKEAGARVYDFWGIPDTESEDEEMAGVYRFKRGWGGRVVQFLGGYEVVYRPLVMRLARRWLV